MSTALTFVLTAWDLAKSRTMGHAPHRTVRSFCPDCQRNARMTVILDQTDEHPGLWSVRVEAIQCGICGAVVQEARTLPMANNGL